MGKMGSEGNKEGNATQEETKTLVGDGRGGGIGNILERKEGLSISKEN